jgi:hypothetical protein
MLMAINLLAKQRVDLNLKVKKLLDLYKYKNSLLKLVQKIILKYRSNRKDLKKRIKNMKDSPTTLNYHKSKLKNREKKYYKICQKKFMVIFHKQCRSNWKSYLRIK